jgi:sporulation protein YlmC with PRC-barrel domain
MKTKILLAIGAATLSCLSVPLWADPLPADSNPRDQDETQTNRIQKLGDLRKANHIIGMEIKNDQGVTLGKVKDLGLDLQNGRIAVVIVATGGFLGMDEKLVAVPPSAFACDKTSKELRANLDKARLKSAPDFHMAEWKEATEDGMIREIYQSYGVRPYYGSISQSGTGANENLITMADTNNPAAGAADATSEGKRGQVSRYYTFDGDNAGKQGTNGSFDVRPQSLGTVVRASKLIGTSAYNTRNEKLGKVENLLVDLPAGRLVEVVLASGGFIGIRGELSSVPPQSFQCDPENKRLTLDATKESLMAASHFKSTEWGYVNEPERVQKVYTDYHVEPYFAARDVDNTARNVRDRSGDTLTPLDQGNSSTDLNTTAQIRRSVLTIDNLSINGRNVKIITVNGQVTLRGVVNSEDEKHQIVDAAAKIAAAGKIDDQLEVKAAAPASTDLHN